ncbi:MAG: hypothetical protein ACKOWO_00655 [Sediminibacterium sp.]|jgi:hypothetical protein
MKVLNLFLIILVTNSCAFHINSGNAFVTLQPSVQAKIKPITIFNTEINDTIYEITADQLLVELKNHTRSLVYIFKSGCDSENCLPLISVENFAKKNNLKLFLVLSSYYDLSKTLNQKYTSQIYSINASYYGSPKNMKYFSKFLENLGYFKIEQEKSKRGSYLFFEGATITKIETSIY